MVVVGDARDVAGSWGSALPIGREDQTGRRKKA